MLQGLLALVGPISLLKEELEAFTETYARQPTDPIELALRTLEGHREGRRLVRYLADKPGRKASLDDIAVELDNSLRITVAKRRKTIRQRFNRTRDFLEEQGCTVRLHIHQSVVSLELILPEPEDATKM